MTTTTTMGAEAWPRDEGDETTGTHVREPLIPSMVGIDASGEEEEEEEGGYEEEDEEEEEGGTPATSSMRVGSGFTARTSSLYVGRMPSATTTMTTEEEEEDVGEERLCDFESYDFRDVDSRWSRRMRKRKNPLRAKWIVTGLIGLFIGVVAFAIDLAISSLFRAKKVVFDLCRDEVELWFALAMSVTMGAALAVASSLLVVYGAPLAKGAGVHYVMASLNAIHIPHVFDMRTLFVKIVATIFSVSSGLMLGPEGPLVYIGTGIAKLFVHGSELGMASLFENDLDRADFESAGAAAGLAAAFGAPIGGVLFSLEEASSFWRDSTTRRSLFAASVSTFVLALSRAILNRSSAAEHTAMQAPGLLRVGDFDSTYYLIELPFFATLAAVCGGISALITKAIMWIASRTPKSNKWRMIQVLIVSVGTTSIFLALSLAGRCNKIDESVDSWSEAATQLWCEKHEYNDVGSILLANKESVISWVLGAPSSAHSFHTLVLCFVATLGALIASATLPVPAGLFMPTILWGSLLGRAYAYTVERSLSSPMGGSPSTSASSPIVVVNHHAYALVGATAALAGMFRANISVVVIMLEGSNKAAFLFPLLIATASANIASRLFFSKSFYEEQIKREGIPFIHASPSKTIEPSLTALDVCSRNVVCFATIEKVGTIENVLVSTTHNGFPIVSARKRLLGIILRKQLVVLLSRRAFIENMVHSPIAIEGEDLDSETGHTENEILTRRIEEYCKELTRLMVHHHHRGGESTRFRRAARRNIVHSLGLTPAEREKRCDVAVFMSLNAISVRSDASVKTCWEIFAKLSLRHLVVIDAKTDEVVGIITRRDLHAVTSG
jgi:chloride channel 7